jgi:hypothetical protein
MDRPGHRCDTASRVDLSWIPLGAGEPLPLVRWNGALYETLVARRERRPALALYHAALELAVDGERYVVEMAPAWQGGLAAGDVAATGPVGLRGLGRSRFFRYQVRCLRDGVIPDLGHAVGGHHRLADDPAMVHRRLDALPAFPTATWGRDELCAGEMWNSNSLIAWLLATSGVDLAHVAPPEGGRAPGWSAGLVVAARDRQGSDLSRCPAPAAAPARGRSRAWARSPSSTRAPRRGCS